MKKISTAIIITIIILTLVSIFITRNFKINLYDLTFIYSILFFLLNFFAFGRKGRGTFDSLNSVGYSSNIVSSNLDLYTLENEKRDKNVNNFLYSHFLFVYANILGVFFMCLTVLLNGIS